MRDFVIRQLLQIKFDQFNIDDSIENKFKQILQEIVLYALSKTNFYNFVSLHGGTCLRIFHDLDRFSEDLDFALVRTNKNFDIRNYFKQLDSVLRSFGLNPSIVCKKYDNNDLIHSCFIKFNTLNELKKIYPDKKLNDMHKDSITKIKFDIDMCIIKSSSVQDIIKTWPLTYKCSIFDLPTLFAGKIHSILCRGWINRIKGRDLYDYLFYLSKNVKINLKYLQQKLINSKKWNKKSLSLNDVKQLLLNKFKTIDFNKAKNDVKGFISNPSVLDNWSFDYFVKTLDNLFID